MMQLKRKTRFLLFLVFAVLVILSGFASSLPDGLEWVLERFGSENMADSFFQAPASDYTIHRTLPEYGNRMISAILGIAIILFLFYIVHKWYHPNKKRNQDQDEA